MTAQGNAPSNAEMVQAIRLLAEKHNRTVNALYVICAVSVMALVLAIGAYL